MSLLVQGERSGRFMRAWSKWCRFWRLTEAIGGIVIGFFMVATGLGFAPLGSGAENPVRWLVVFAASPLVYGGVSIVLGIRDFRRWQRAR